MTQYRIVIEEVERQAAIEVFSSVEASATLRSATGKWAIGTLQNRLERAQPEPEEEPEPAAPADYPPGD